MSKQFRDWVTNGAPSDYQQGYASGANYVVDVLRKRSVGLDAEGNVYDLIRAAAAGYVPDDVISQIEERVPAQARPDFEAGFIAACRDALAEPGGESR
jgi:hypothetical protein